MAFSVCAQSQDGFSFDSEQIRTNVVSLERFTSDHHIEGTNNSSDEFTVSFTVSSSATLDEIEVITEHNGKFRKLNLKEHMSISTMDWSAFFTGSQTYSIRIPASCQFTLRYTTSYSNTLFFSSISKKGRFGAETYSYHLQLPEGLILTTDNGRKFSGKDIVLDSTVFSPASDQLYCLIHPENHQPEQYFSNWFAERIEPLTAIDPNLIPENLKQIRQKGNNKELATACFRFVQNEISYIDIEDGINAYIPRPAQQTLVNKMGDCKDMSNLLHSLLKSFGFETYLGISRTSAKKDTFDFPSLHMANHMIVALKLDDRFVYLDATEDECLFGDPSFQILGTEVFLIGHKDSHFMQVPATPSQPAAVHCNYNFVSKENSILLEIQLSATGKLNRLFYGLQRDHKLNNDNLARYLSYLFTGKFILDQYAVSDTFGLLKLHITVPPSYINVIGSNTYIDLSFLPDLKRISSFFYGSETIAFPADFTLRFCGVKQPKMSDVGQYQHVVMNSDATSFTLQSSADADALKNDGDFQRFWKSFSAKPFILSIP